MTEITNGAVFFNRSSINQKRRKIKPIVYHIYHCCKYRQNETDDTGSWCCLIVKQHQDSFSNLNTDSAEQTTYMLSSIESNSSHVRIRLTSLLESLTWISDATNGIAGVEAVFISTDVFIVNMLREWIPKWAKSSFKLKQSGEEYPNYDILVKIFQIIKDIKLTVRWQSENSNEMITISKKVSDLLI